MRTLYALVVLSILGTFGNAAVAQGVITWDTANNYPMTSTVKTCSISIKGSIAVDADWKVNNVYYHVWRDGLVVAKVKLTFTAKNEWPEVGGKWVQGEMQDLAALRDFVWVDFAQ